MGKFNPRKLPANVEKLVLSIALPHQLGQVIELAEEALTSLIAECSNISKAKYWSDSAEAMAAMAKIERSDRLAELSRLVKLEALNQMAKLAGCLERSPSGKKRPRTGTIATLQQHGLTRVEAMAGARLASMPKAEFEKVLERAPRPSAIVAQRVSRSETYGLFMGNGSRFVNLLRFCKENDPDHLARSLATDEIPYVRVVVVQISEWLDRLEQHLPKEKP